MLKKNGEEMMLIVEHGKTVAVRNEQAKQLIMKTIAKAAMEAKGESNPSLLKDGRSSGLVKQDQYNMKIQTSESHNLINQI